MRVAVFVNTRFKAARDIVKGILRYTATHPRIELNVVESLNIRYDFTEFGDWHPDGMISDNNGAVALGEKTLRAVVFLHGSEWAGDCPNIAKGYIFCDDAAVGRMAATHFLRRDMRHFGFVGALHAPNWSRQRGEAFASEIAKAGREKPFEFRVELPCNLADEKTALAAWLGELPKPCGVFAASDLRAKHVLDVCRECGIAVPELVKVLGVDNEEYLCEQSMPALSSIEPDFESGGFEAIRMLDDMLSGKNASPEPFKYGIRGLVERRSTRDDSGTARLVNLALDFIRLHGASGGTAAEAVKAAGCSASLLQRLFRKTLGRTVVQEIQRVRMEKAKKLLRDTDTPIGEIAQLCGYDDESYLKLLFRRTFGMSMSKYRAMETGK